MSRRGVIWIARGQRPRVPRSLTAGYREVRRARSAARLRLARLRRGVLLRVLVFQFLQRAPRQHLRGRAHAVGDQDAVEVVDLVLPDARDVSGGALLDGVA